MAADQELVELDPDGSLWSRVFCVAPLVVVGTREADGADDLAPKHLAMPLSWERHYGFVCTPRHRTYQNIRRETSFTVTYVRPSQTVLASLAASPRCEDGSKPISEALPTFPAQSASGAFLADGYLFLECELDRIIDQLDDNALIIGRIIAARAAADSLRRSDLDDQDLLRDAPLLTYLHPGRCATISDTLMMPFPSGFKR